MKSPLTYYGGKQKLMQHILPMIPEHVAYCEPFAGGAAVLFGKPKSKIEVINDTNGELINFYKQVKTNYSKLLHAINATLHSREIHRKARFVYQHPWLFDEIERAWSIFTMAHQSYSSILDSTWSCGFQSDTAERKFQKKKEGFVHQFAERLERVQLECRDAIEVIEARDSETTFFYLDPPYFNSDMGHYKGYTKEQFETLLQKLSTIKGKFLLSSYPSELLKKYARKYKWNIKTIEMALNVQGAIKNGRRKTEVLTGNYPLNDHQNEK